MMTDSACNAGSGEQLPYGVNDIRIHIRVDDVCLGILRSYLMQRERRISLRMILPSLEPSGEDSISAHGSIRCPGLTSLTRRGFAL